MNATITAAQQAQIDYILDHFRFERVQRAMAALDWRWHYTEAGTDQVPEVHDLRQAARGYLRTVAAGKSDYFSSGGFVAERDKAGNLSLTFELEQEFAAPRRGDGQ